jgi:hypothetical protein
MSIRCHAVCSLAPYVFIHFDLVETIVGKH